VGGKRNYFPFLFFSQGFREGLYFDGGEEKRAPGLRSYFPRKQLGQKDWPGVLGSNREVMGPPNLELERVVEVFSVGNPKGVIIFLTKKGCVGRSSRVIGG